MTRILEASPRKVFPSRVPTTSRSPTHQNIPRRQSAAELSRKQSIAAVESNHRRNRHHHRVSSYQQLIEPRQSFSFGTSSRSNTGITAHSGTANQRLSFETVRPIDHRQSFDRQTLRPPRSSLETKVMRGLRNESVDDTGPRLQRSTSGLAFDDSTTEY